MLLLLCVLFKVSPLHHKKTSRVFSWPLFPPGDTFLSSFLPLRFFHLIPARSPLGPLRRLSPAPSRPHFCDSGWNTHTLVFFLRDSMTAYVQFVLRVHQQHDPNNIDIRVEPKVLIPFSTPTAARPLGPTGWSLVRLVSFLKPSSRISRVPFSCFWLTTSSNPSTSWAPWSNMLSQALLLLRPRD